MPLDPKLYPGCRYCQGKTTISTVYAGGIYTFRCFRGELTQVNTEPRDQLDKRLTDPAALPSYGFDATPAGDAG